VEIALRTSLYAIGADTGLGDIEIDFHDPVLAPDRLDQEGEIGFQALAEKAAALPEKGIFGDLLGNGRATSYPAALGIALDRFLDRLGVKPIVAAELPVLGCDHRTHHIR